MKEMSLSGSRKAPVSGSLVAIAAVLLTACATLQEAAQASPGTLDVPVLKADFPDPFILHHQGQYLAYATNTAHGAVNVQMASSPDLADWRRIEQPGSSGRLLDAMPELPSWALRGFTWAPEVIEADGRFVLYFTARHAKSGLQCVGAATSSDPRGPFTSDAPEPLVCQYELGGTIDASPFRDADGQIYLYFKNDGNNPDFNLPTEIFAQRLSPDGLKLTGERVPLVRNDRAWEGRVVEAPTMIRQGRSYVLFYSANDYGWQDSQRVSDYAIGYATCAQPMGPCTDAPGNPFLASRTAPTCLSGPGHQAVIRTEAMDFIAFHSWAPTQGCRLAHKGRFMHIAPLSWRNGLPEIGSARNGATQ